MATTLGFKDLIDLPEWRPLSNSPSTSGAGMALACDLRNSEDRNPWLWELATTAILNAYHLKNDDWLQLAFTTLGGAVIVGSGAMFVPSAGPNGTLTGGNTTTSVVLNTALPQAVAANQLANRGDGRGFRIRIIGKSAGGSGKTEERLIIANTAGTTPTLTLDSPLSFTPAVGDVYEILSGRIYLLGAGATAAGFWKYYDVATGFTSGNLSVTNLAATVGTDFCALSLDELYVPATRSPGDGFLGNLTATGMTAGTLTGQAAGGDAGVLANEYRNFQIRIVQDTATPTAVGQRRKISSHTAGASPVYTLAANWTVTPSTTAVYVIENNNDLLLWTNAAAVTYSYAAGGGNAWADAAWSTAAVAGGATQYANPLAAMGAGCMCEQPFGITLDAAKNARYSRLVWFRGAAANAIYEFDLANGPNGTWVQLSQLGQLPNTLYGVGSSSTYDGATNGGRYMYINYNGGQRLQRFDMLNRVFEPFAFLRYGQSTAVGGPKLACSVFVDSATKLGFLTMRRNSGVETFQVALQR